MSEQNNTEKEQKEATPEELKTRMKKLYLEYKYLYTHGGLVGIGTSEIQVEVDYLKKMFPNGAFGTARNGLSVELFKTSDGVKFIALV